MTDSDVSEDSYLEYLLNERGVLDVTKSTHAIRLLDKEIARVRAGEPKGGKDDAPEFDEEIKKVIEKIILPVEDYPRIDFVQKFRGWNGCTLKGIQSATNSKIAILGQGSTGEGKKEEDRLLETGEEKYKHLTEPLHLLVQTEGPTSEAHVKMASALMDLKRALDGKYDDIHKKKETKDSEKKGEGEEDEVEEDEKENQKGRDESREQSDDDRRDDRREGRNNRRNWSNNRRQNWRNRRNSSRNDRRGDRKDDKKSRDNSRDSSRLPERSEHDINMSRLNRLKRDLEKTKQQLAAARGVSQSGDEEQPRSRDQSPDVKGDRHKPREHHRDSKEVDSKEGILKELSPKSDVSDAGRGFYIRRSEDREGVDKQSSRSPEGRRHSRSKWDTEREQEDDSDDMSEEERQQSPVQRRILDADVRQGSRSSSVNPQRALVDYGGEESDKEIHPSREAERNRQVVGVSDRQSSERQSSRGRSSGRSASPAQGRSRSVESEQNVSSGRPEFKDVFPFSGGHASNRKPTEKSPSPYESFNQDDNSNEFGDNVNDTLRELDSDLLKEDSGVINPDNYRADDLINMVDKELITTASSGQLERGRDPIRRSRSNQSISISPPSSINTELPTRDEVYQQQGSEQGRSRDSTPLSRRSNRDRRRNSYEGRSPRREVHSPRREVHSPHREGPRGSAGAGSSDENVHRRRRSKSHDEATSQLSLHSISLSPSHSITLDERPIDRPLTREEFYKFKEREKEKSRRDSRDRSYPESNSRSHSVSSRNRIPHQDGSVASHSSRRDDQRDHRSGSHSNRNDNQRDEWASKYDKPLERDEWASKYDKVSERDEWASKYDKPLERDEWASKYDKPLDRDEWASKYDKPEHGTDNRYDDSHRERYNSQDRSRQSRGSTRERQDQRNRYTDNTSQQDERSNNRDGRDAYDNEVGHEYGNPERGVASDRDRDQAGNDYDGRDQPVDDYDNRDQRGEGYDRHDPHEQHYYDETNDRGKRDNNYDDLDQRDTNYDQRDQRDKHYADPVDRDKNYDNSDERDKNFDHHVQRDKNYEERDQRDKNYDRHDERKQSSRKNEVYNANDHQYGDEQTHEQVDYDDNRDIHGDRQHHEDYNKEAREKGYEGREQRKADSRQDAYDRQSDQVNRHNINDEPEEREQRSGNRNRQDRNEQRSKHGNHSQQGKHEGNNQLGRHDGKGKEQHSRQSDHHQHKDRYDERNPDNKGGGDQGAAHDNRNPNRSHDNRSQDNRNQDNRNQDNRNQDNRNQDNQNPNNRNQDNRNQDNRSQNHRNLNNRYPSNRNQGNYDNRNQEQRNQNKWNQAERHQGSRNQENRNQENQGKWNQGKWHQGNRNQDNHNQGNNRASRNNRGQWGNNREDWRGRPNEQRPVNEEKQFDGNKGNREPDLREQIRPRDRNYPHPKSHMDEKEKTDVDTGAAKAPNQLDVLESILTVAAIPQLIKPQPPTTEPEEEDLRNVLNRNALTEGAPPPNPGKYNDFFSDSKSFPPRRRNPNNIEYTTKKFKDNFGDPHNQYPVKSNQYPVKGNQWDQPEDYDYDYDYGPGDEQDLPHKRPFNRGPNNRPPSHNKGPYNNYNKGPPHNKGNFPFRKGHGGGGHKWTKGDMNGPPGNSQGYKKFNPAHQKHTDIGTENEPISSSPPISENTETLGEVKKDEAGYNIF